MQEKGNMLEELIRHPLTWLSTGGGLTLMVERWFARKKSNAEAKQVDAGAESTLAKSALEFANDGMRSLEERLDRAMKWIATLEGKNNEQFFELQKAKILIEHLQQENAQLRTKLGLPPRPDHSTPQPSGGA